MALPRPDHPWYGRKNHVKTRKPSEQKIREALIDREIERSLAVDRMEDLEDLEGSMRPARDPSVEYIEGGLRRMPVRYDGGE